MNGGMLNDEFPNGGGTDLGFRFRSELRVVLCALGSSLPLGSVTLVRSGFVSLHLCSSLHLVGLGRSPISANLSSDIDKDHSSRLRFPRRSERRRVSRAVV